MSNPKVATIVAGILAYLKGQDALGLLPEVVKELKSYKVENSAVVESAVELSPTQKEEIKSLLTQNYEVGEVEFNVKPELIAGLKISIGDQVIDSSVQARLEEIYA
jgi:F-type H+-transporting ATPase subunit delta